MKCSVLNNRGFILVSGEDAKSFLQGIITNDVMNVAHDKAIYSCFLTPQGKYLADFFMYDHKGDVLLDVDQSILQNLLKRMSMFKLRSKVTLEDVSDQFSMHAIWDTHVTPDIPNVHIFADPRADVMGYRILGTKETVLESASDDYLLWQMQNGIANVTDFERERTTMLEANMDFLNALSWTKGCYMGQELTARTHYRGLTKKRFLPVKLSAAQDIAVDTVVTQNDKTIGFVRGVRGEYALAQIQLEAVQKDRQCMIDGQQAAIQIPEWFAVNMQAE